MRMRSLKVLREQFDEARFAARAIYDEAVAAGPDSFTRDQSARFDKHAVVANRLKQEIQLARLERENITSAVTRRGEESNMSTSTHRSDLVLPSNGRLPGEAKARYNRHHRSGKLFAFKDEQTAFDSGQWLKAVVARACHGTIDGRAEDYCASIGLEVSVASHEGGGTSGGYTVPSPVSAAIINILETVGVSRQACRVLPTSADTISVPKKTGGLTAYVTQEMGTITDSDPTWGLVSAVVKKRAVLSYLSQELNDDSLIGIADFLISEMAYALALKEDDELLNGDGGSLDGGILGLIPSIGSAGVYTCDANENLWSEIDLEDCIGTIGKLPDRYFTYGPKWICSFSFFNQVMARLSFQAGGVTQSEVMSGVGNRRSFLGYDVLLTSQMPTAQADSTICALFGAFDQAVLFADRGDMRFSRSDDYKFAQDMISLRATHRYDMTIHEPGDSSTAGGYTALKTNAA